MGYNLKGRKELDTTEQLNTFIYGFFYNVFLWLSVMLPFQVSLVAQMVKNLPAMQKTWVQGLGRSLGGEHGNPLQYSCLENSMDRKVWRGTVHGVTQNWTRLSD